MAELSPTLRKQDRLLKAIYNVHEKPSTESWQALQAAADVVNQSAVQELAQLRNNLTELTASAMNLSITINDEDEEELMNTLTDLNSEIEDRAQSFIELNAIRLDAQYEAERAKQAIANS